METFIAAIIGCTIGTVLGNTIGTLVFKKIILKMFKIPDEYNKGINN
ncbi:MAG: hypothetical protein ABF633_01685 [Clostridium sp.]